MISVIIPVFNGEKYIEASLKSVINQTLQPIEIVVVNDGSTDNTPVIIDEYANKYANIKVIHQQKRGPSNARNQGVKYASYDWICFVDADDIIHPQRLEIANHYKNDCDAVVCDYIRFHEDHELDLSSIDYETITFDNPKNSNFKVLSFGYGLPRMLMKKQVYLDTGGLDENLIHNEDHEFHFRMLIKGYVFKKINYANFYFYRQHNAPDKISSQQSRIQNTFKALYKMADNIHKLPPDMMEHAKKVISNRIVHNALKFAVTGSTLYSKHIAFAKKLHSDIQPYKSKNYNAISKFFGYGNIEFLYGKIKKFDV